MQSEKCRSFKSGAASVEAGPFKSSLVSWVNGKSEYLVVNIVLNKRFEQVFEGLVVPRLIVLRLAQHDVVEGFTQGFLMKIAEVVQLCGIVFDPLFDDLISAVAHRHFFVHVFKIGIGYRGIQRNLDFDHIEQRFRHLHQRQLPGLLPLIGKEQVITKGIVQQQPQ